MNDVLALRLRVIEDRLKALEDRPYAVPGEVVSLPDPEPVPVYGSLQKMHDPYKPDPEPERRVRHICGGTESCVCTSDPEPVPVFEPCACKEVTLARGQLEKVTDSRYTRTTHYRECCPTVSPIPKDPDPEPPAASIMHPVFPRCHCPLCSPKPEPVPQWREGIEDVERLDSESALKDALYSLFIACNADEDGLLYALRSLVARCEAQVGDGWQAHPDRVPRGHWGVAWLMVPMSHETPEWTVAGNRAAAWLRDLTEADA